MKTNVILFIDPSSSDYFNFQQKNMVCFEEILDQDEIEKIFTTHVIVINRSFAHCNKVDIKLKSDKVNYQQKSKINCY